jgi:hypothetical protein
LLEENIRKKINTLAATITKNEDSLTKDRIRKSDFDKTLVGTVVGWEYADQTIIDGYDRSTHEAITHTETRVRWVVLSNNIEYKVWQNYSDITSIGQHVRLYYPNNDDTQKYAEVINLGQQTYMLAHPNKCEYDSEKHMVTETWALNDGTFVEKYYKLQIRENEDTGENEVYRMDMPDGTQIKLEGFYLDNFS